MFPAILHVLTMDVGRSAGVLLVATKTGGKPGLIIVVGVVAAVALGGPLRDTVSDALGELVTPDPVIIADDGVELLVAGDQEAKMKRCEP